MAWANKEKDGWRSECAEREEEKCSPRREEVGFNARGWLAPMVGVGGLFLCPVAANLLVDGFIRRSGKSPRRCTLHVWGKGGGHAADSEERWLRSRRSSREA